MHNLLRFALLMINHVREGEHSALVSFSISRSDLRVDGIEVPNASIPLDLKDCEPLECTSECVLLL